MVLALDGAIEKSHMGHPDFRVNGKIFATLHPGGECGMVKLTPEQQEEFMADDSGAFEPASGAWGRQGSTMVKLAKVNADTLGQAMTLAWQNTKKPSPVKREKKR